MSTRLAITGGTGFVGQHVLRVAREQGIAVRALARTPQPDTPGVAWLRGSLSDPAALAALVTGCSAVVHLAGVINAPDRAAFDAGNVAGTAVMLAAAETAGVRRFVHVSSLAAREPGLSMYGASKAAAEALVAASPLDWTIVRPPAVYGPGDRETLAFYQLVARGLAVLPGRGRFSAIEVGDLARALLAVTPAEGLRGTFGVDDGTRRGHDYAELAGTVAHALGKRPLRLRVPGGALRLGAAADTALSRWRGRQPRLSFDRARYIAHADWTLNDAERLPAAIWTPAIGLAEGVQATADWYRTEGWL